MRKITTEEFKAMQAKGSKYKNEKTTYKNERYDSKKEADYARTLDISRHATKAADRVILIQKQFPFACVVKGKKICTYVADFVVRYADMRKEVVDVKGFRTDVYKLKKKLVEALYKIEIKEI